MMLILATQAAQQASVSQGWFNDLLAKSGADSTWGLLLLGFGAFAQLVFFGRWVVQWIESEKRGESHVPQLFWWLSLAGATMLLIYFVLRFEPVGIMGQAFGWVVYSRNLYLINKKGRKEAHLPEGPGGEFEPQ